MSKTVYNRGSTGTSPCFKFMSKLNNLHQINHLHPHQDSTNSSESKDNNTTISYFEVDEHNRFNVLPSNFSKRYQIFKTFTVGFFCASFLLLISLIYITCSLINPFFLQDFFTRSFDSHHTLALIDQRKFSFLTNVEFLNKDKPVLPIHSHNDYLRKMPLFDALRLGFDSVEADVWSIPSKHPHDRNPRHGYNHEFMGDDTLYVGHHKRFLSSYKTLENMYLNPLENLLDQVNSRNVIDNEDKQPYGVFYNEPLRTLYLIIDIKNDRGHVFKKLQSSLTPFMEKNYLTTFDTRTKEWKYGPITIIISGYLPYNLVKEQTIRNCFLDAPLRELLEDDYEVFKAKYTPEISIFGSDSLERITGSKKALNSELGLNEDQLGSLKKVIDRSHELGIKARIWETPSWPVNQRNKVWNQLMELGVDSLNVDDLKGAVDLF